MWWPSHERPKQSSASILKHKNYCYCYNIVIYYYYCYYIIVVVVVDDDTYYWVHLSSDHLFQVYYKVRRLLQSATEHLAIL